MNQIRSFLLSIVIQNINDEKEWNLEVGWIRENNKNYVSIKGERRTKVNQPTKYIINKPFLVDEIVDGDYCEGEGLLKITNKPIICNEDTVFEIASYINMPDKLELPMVYVSAANHENGVRNSLDCSRLAKILSGCAYVVQEDCNDDSINDKLMHLTLKRNAHSGYIGIYFPGNRFETLVKAYKKTYDMCEEELFSVIVDYHSQKDISIKDRIKYAKSYKKIAVPASIISSVTEESAKIKELLEYIDVADETEKELKAEIERLKEQNQKLKQQLSEESCKPTEKKVCKNDGISLNTKIEEFYPGEINDMLLSILEQVGERLENSDETSTRRHEIICDLILNNDAVGECERTMREIKNLLMSEGKWSESVINRLESLGFVIDKNNHYKLTFHNNSKYLFTASVTPSDTRSGKNLYKFIDKKLNVVRKFY